MNIQTHDELYKKLNMSLSSNQNMIIQEQAIGDEHRILFFDDEIIIYYQRKPWFVVWDWQHTLKELIQIENTNNPLRSDGYKKPLSYIIADNEAAHHLKVDWLGFDSIPKDWEEVQIRPNSHVGMGWMHINQTSIIHASYLDLCKQIKHYFWLRFMWLDVMTTDISKDLAISDAKIIEFNDCPSIGAQKQISQFNTAKRILEKLFFDWIMQ